MVERGAKNRRKLFSGWLCVVIARSGALGPCIKQIGRLVGTSQWAQQEKVLRPIWTYCLIIVKVDESLIRAAIQF